MLVAWVMMSVLSGPADLQTVARGTLSGIEEPRQAVVQSREDWEALWRAHAPGQIPPEVDFTRRTVLAVFLGSKMTAGFDVEITEIETRPAGATVRYRERAPAPDEMTAQVITSPFHIISVPRVAGEVTFVKAARER
ncbi:MAG TPA: protease complex subunit PrcB family protein [Vicinamibacterales bacterium]|nr:protease complex subunit PrcB family protein [Vicinamibacterales bacterium]